MKKVSFIAKFDGYADGACIDGWLKSPSEKTSREEWLEALKLMDEFSNILSSEKYFRLTIEELEETK